MKRADRLTCTRCGKRLSRKTARQFGVSRAQIWRIRKGESWGVDVTTLRAEAEAFAA